jgi:hypothetical protein
MVFAASFSGIPTTLGTATFGGALSKAGPLGAGSVLALALLAADVVSGRIKLNASTNTKKNSKHTMCLLLMQMFLNVE